MCPQRRQTSTTKWDAEPMPLACVSAGSSETPTRPQSARPRAPTDMSSLPRFMQPTAAAMLHQGREIEHEAAPTAKQGATVLDRHVLMLAVRGSLVLYVHACVPVC
eukprot:scaffold204200_cov21-Tisochrysis_lutea.AAC.1